MRAAYENTEMGFYPIFLEMNGRRCVVIGGGTVGERKVQALIDAGACVTAIAPEMGATLIEWSQQQRIHAVMRPYQTGDLAECEIVFVATDNRQLNAAVRDEAKNRGVWVNAADDPEHCDFILPSVLRRGTLTVAVSSGGESPALARAVREELENYFGPDYEVFASLAAEARTELRAQGIAPSYDKWHKALTGEFRQWVARGERHRAKAVLLKALGAAS